MRRKSLVEKLGVSHDMLNLSDWSIVDTNALDEVAAEKYQNRKRAVELRYHLIPINFNYSAVIL